MLRSHTQHTGPPFEPPASFHDSRRESNGTHPFQRRTRYGLVIRAQRRLRRRQRLRRRRQPSTDATSEHAQPRSRASSSRNRDLRGRCLHELPPGTREKAFHAGARISRDVDSAEHVSVVAVQGQRIEPRRGDEEKAARPRRRRQLPQYRQGIRHVLEHMVRDYEIECRFGGQRRKAVMPWKGAVQRRFDAERFPPAALQHVQELSSAAAEVEHT